MYRPRAWVERQRSDGSASTLVHVEYQRTAPRISRRCAPEDGELAARERAVTPHRAGSRARTAHVGDLVLPGTVAAPGSRMPGSTPRTYDEITRATVPDPDSSYRPTPEQQRATAAGELFVSADERALHDAVSNALSGSGVDVSDVSFEISGTRVTLRGRVDDVHLLPRIEAAVRDVEGVGDIVDLLVVDAGTR